MDPVYEKKIKDIGTTGNLLRKNFRLKINEKIFI